MGKLRYSVPMPTPARRAMSSSDALGVVLRERLAGGGDQQVVVARARRLASGVAVRARGGGVGAHGGLRKSVLEKWRVPPYTNRRTPPDLVPEDASSLPLPSLHRRDLMTSALLRHAPARLQARPETGPALLLAIILSHLPDDHPRRLDRDHGAAGHPRGARLLGHRPVVGAERLHAHVRRPAPARRPRRRHPRPAPRLHRRHRRLHGRLVPRRPRRVGRLAARSPRRSRASAPRSPRPPRWHC